MNQLVQECSNTDLNTSTAHRKISGKKSSYVQLKLLHNGHNCPRFHISYRRLKTQKHSVSIGLPCCGISFYEHFNRQFNYAGFLYSKS